MASTSTKPTAGSKQGARSVSSSRLVANKSVKTPKVSVPPAKRNSSAPSVSAPALRGGASSVSAPALRGGASIPPAGKKLAAVAPPTTSDTRSTGNQDKGAQNKSELKAQFARLSAATSQITGLKRSLNKSFYDVGTLLNQIRNERLYEVKGYGSFESFVERELDLNKVLCMRAARIAEAIHRDQALAAGLERAAAAVAALDGETEPVAPTRPAGSPAGGIPVHKQ